MRRKELAKILFYETFVLNGLYKKLLSVARINESFCGACFDTLILIVGRICQFEASIVHTSPLLPCFMPTI